MSSEPSSPPVAPSLAPAALDVADSASDVPSPRAASVWTTRRLAIFFLAVCAVAATVSAMLWQRLSIIQEQLDRQSQEVGAAIEARALAKQAQDLARETAARQALMETRFSEVALQRSQIEELIQSLSRSRDENLVVDIESGLRLAQQQAQLTGSVEPLLAELRSADKRLERAAQPGLSRLRGALARDLDRIKGANTTDTLGLLVKLDELARQVDELPLVNAVASSGALLPSPKPAPVAQLQWWEQILADIRDEARSLLRVTRIDQPDAVLLTPEQGFFLRENLKLRLLNARLGLLARQTDSARADVAAAQAALRKYFDPASRKTQVALNLAQQVQGQLRAIELPRIDETFAALATAAAGK
jgi:uroporphyrin-3 C-methyltransferase